MTIILYIMDKLMQIYPGAMTRYAYHVLKMLDYEFIVSRWEILEIYHDYFLIKYMFMRDILMNEEVWTPEFGIYFVYMLKWGGYIDLMDHPNIVKYVLRYPDLDWPWDALSSNRELTPDVIRQLPDRVLALLEWETISRRDDLDIPFVSEYKDWISWQYASVIFSRDEILANPDLPWIDHESDGPSPEVGVTWEYVFSNPELYWNYEELFRQLPINETAIHKYVRTESDALVGLSENRLLTKKLIDDYPDLLWDMSNIYRNTSIDIDSIIEIYKTYSHQWLTKVIVSRSDCTWLTIAKHPEIQWDWRKIVRRFKNTRVPWTPDIHKYFPEWDKRIVWMVLFIMRRELIPYNIIFTILRMVI